MSLRERVRTALWGEKILEVDSSQGAFWSYANSKVKHYTNDNVKDYFNAYMDHDLVRLYVDDLVEAAVGQGFYTTTEEEYPNKKDSPKYHVDQFNQHFDLDNLLPNICRITLIAGFCPVETKLVRNLEKSSLAIVDPRTIDWHKNKGVEAKLGKIIRVHQKVNEKVNIIESSDLAWFNYSQVGTNPLGNSFVRGLIELINILNDATDDVKKILKRYIAPLGVWKTTQTVDNMKRAVLERDPGQDIFIGNMRRDDVENPNVPMFFTVDPRVPFWDFIEYLDRRIYSYSRANNLWYVRNATQASAKEMDDIVSRHIGAIQRDMRRPVEKYWYKPYVDLKGYSEVPKIAFGYEQTGIEDIDISTIITELIKMGYLTDTQAMAILKALVTLPDLEDVGGAQTEPGIEEPTEESFKKAVEDVLTSERFQEQMAGLRGKEYNAVYDTCMAMRFHAIDMTVDRESMRDIAEKQARRYGEEPDDVYERARQILELEGYMIVDRLTQRQKSDLSGGENR